MKLCTFVELQDIIKHANFYLFLINGLRARGGGQKIGLPFEMHMALTTLACAAALASDVTVVAAAVVIQSRYTIHLYRSFN